MIIVYINVNQTSATLLETKTIVMYYISWGSYVQYPRNYTHIIWIQANFISLIAMLFLFLDLLLYCAS